MRSLSHRFRTTIGWMVGATSAAALLAPGTARAFSVCSDPLTTAGGSTIGDATNVTDCSFSSITGTFSDSEYWEFQWSGTGSGDVTAMVTGAPFGGSFGGDLAVYTPGGTPIASDIGVPNIGFGGSSSEFSLPGVLSTDGDYIVGLEGTPDEAASFTISFQAATVPEPASFGLLGGALASFGLLRGRKRRPN